MTESQGTRELLAVREIAHAFLVADRAGDVQQFALDRLTPLLGASFSLVMELGADGELLRPVAQHEWPARHRHWIGALRVRVGDGPSGVAVAERRLVEVEDLFADPALEGWHEVARELSFRSIIAAPLETADGPIGAIAFYFADATCLNPEQRALVRVAADQLAAATDKARRTDALRRAHAALAEANAELATQARAWAAAEQARDVVERQVVEAMLVLTSPESTEDAAERLAAAHALALASHEFTRVSRADFVPEVEDVDPRDPLRDAVSRWRHRAPMLVIQVDEPMVLLPTVNVSQDWLTRAVELALGLAVRTADPGEVVQASIQSGRGFLALQVRWRATHAATTHAATTHATTFDAGATHTAATTGVTTEAATNGAGLVDGPADILEQVGRRVGDRRLPPAPAAVCRAVTAIDLPLLRAITARLGGDLRIERLPPADADAGPEMHALILIFPVDLRG